jgi:DegV family protein with EDD domain
MAKIKITCDSTCDLTPELYRRFDLEVLPLEVTLGDRVCHDGVDVTTGEIYDYARKSGALPKTSAVSVGAYEDCFRRWTEAGYDVVHVNISNKLSACYQNACIAAEGMDNVFVVDSLNLSSGSGQLAMAAAEMAAEGAAAAEIADRLNEMRLRLDVSFVLQTLEYLHKGGRCSGVAALGANLLKLRPEIVVSNEGTMSVGRKYRGNMEKTVLDYIRGRLEGNDNVIPGRIMVTHTDMPQEIVDKAVELVKSLHPFKEVLPTSAGSTIGSHCGPACIGVLFFRKTAK